VAMEIEPERREEHRSEVVELPSGDRLHLWRREQPAARGQVVIVHGFGEHSGRYSELTESLLQRGFNVSSFDQRGHGRSSGIAGHINRFADYQRDLAVVIESAIARGPKPLFLIGHSMGGLITLRYLACQAQSIGGAVVSAPLLGFAVQIPKFKAFIGKATGLIAPRLRMANEIDPAVLSRDPEVGRAYAADPLVRRVVSARWFNEALRAMKEMPAAAPAISAPMLVLHGTDDRLAGVGATRSVFDLIGSMDKELIVYPGFYHELFNEPERQQIFQTVGDWLTQRLID